MSNNKIDLRPNELELTRHIILKHIPADAHVWVFGSRAKGCARLFSDLDLIIDLNGQPLPLRTLTQLLDDFEESDLPYKVDIVDWNTSSDAFKTTLRASRISLFLDNQRLNH